MTTASTPPMLTWARASVVGIVAAGALIGCVTASTPTSGAPVAGEAVGSEVATCLSAQGWDVSHVSADGFRVNAGLPVDQQDDIQLSWSDCVGTPATFSVPLPE